MEVYSYTNGYSATEQDLITDIDTFLTSTVGGWERHYTVSDTASNRDYCWASYGTVSGTYRRIFVRMRAESDYVYLYGYQDFTDESTNEGEIYDSSYTRIPTGSAPFRYWLVGNEDFVQVHVGQSYHYMAYAGLINTYYLPETDDYPLLIRGQSSSSTGWESTTSLYMHNPTTSGEQAYRSYSAGWASNVLDKDVGLRDSKVLALPLVIYSSTASNYEVRGEPFGIYVSNKNYIAHQAQLLTASGTFISFDVGSYRYSVGPVASGTCDVF